MVSRLGILDSYYSQVPRSTLKLHTNNLSDPRNRSHKSLWNHNFEVASFPHKNHSKIAVSQSQKSHWAKKIAAIQNHTLVVATCSGGVPDLCGASETQKEQRETCKMGKVESPSWSSHQAGKERGGATPLGALRPLIAHQEPLCWSENPSENLWQTSDEIPEVVPLCAVPVYTVPLYLSTVPHYLSTVLSAFVFLPLGLISQPLPARAP